MIRLSLVVSIVVCFSGCASTGAVPRPFPQPGGYPGGPARGAPDPLDPSAPPRRPIGATGSADGYSISSTALSLRGAPYRDGGADPNGFDCSGLVSYVFAQHGVSVPRDVRRQYQIGSAVNGHALEPGDLVFFTTVTPGASHVGIVIGGDQFVHAPSGSGVVRIDALSAQYWSTRFIGARRVN
jgi:cell wall-associated NlpC family hydrolase